MFLMEVPEFGCCQIACGVTTYSEEFGEDIDVTECGTMCPYHKVIHYCSECQIKRAIHLAMHAHQGQLDDSGKDYFTAHLYPVFNMVSMTTTDHEVRMAAILHDVIEDTDITPLELEAVFGKRVCDLVMEVTHEGKKERKAERGEGGG